MENINLTKTFKGINGTFVLTAFNPIEVFAILKDTLKALKIPLTSVSVIENVNNFLEHICNLDEVELERIINKFFAKVTLDGERVTQETFTGQMSAFISVITWICEENHFFENENISLKVKEKVAEFLGLNL